MFNVPPLGGTAARVSVLLTSEANLLLFHSVAALCGHKNKNRNTLGPGDEMCQCSHCFIYAELKDPKCSGNTTNLVRMSACLYYFCYSVLFQPFLQIAECMMRPFYHQYTSLLIKSEQHVMDVTLNGRI